MSDKIIGSALVRCLAVTSVALAAIWAATFDDVASAWHATPLALRGAWLVATFVTTVLSSHHLYVRWDAIAARINGVMIRVIFSIVYCVVVPPFALWSQWARRRRREDPNTYWIERPQPDSPADSFDGMD